ncbi:MAG TPA: TlpA disulfide reductase family protein [Gaiellaceae bacterium]|jgi:cytochrome c biogenesis protein CcmG/thiol:disulfide interchange protein DsbE
MTTRIKLGAQALAVGLVLALLALLIWKVAFKNNGGGVAAKIDKGHITTAPNFTLGRLDKQGRLALDSLRGKAVVLNFWASWCFPCNKEAPALEKTWQRHDGKVVVLGVDVNDFSGDARKFMQQHGVTYPIVHDNKYVTYGAYGLTGLPETFFVDPRGRVVGHYAGQVTESILSAGIERAQKA